MILRLSILILGYLVAQNYLIKSYWERHPIKNHWLKSFHHLLAIGTYDLVLNVWTGRPGKHPIVPISFFFAEKGSIGLTMLYADLAITYELTIQRIPK